MSNADVKRIFELKIYTINMHYKKLMILYDIFPNPLIIIKDERRRIHF